MSVTTSSRRFRTAVPGRLWVEALEAREVPAYVSGGTLWIEGSNAVDTVTVTFSAGSGWAGTLPKYVVVHNGVRQTFSTFAVTSGDVRFAGYGGDDYFQNNSDLRARADGGPGNDYLDGGRGNDTLIGNTGGDILGGNEGHDTLYGEKGIFSFGTAGSDVLLGGPGNDYLDGGGAGDGLDGGAGNDTLFGNAGPDMLLDSAGTDWMDGGDDRDVLAASGDLNYWLSDSYFVGRGSANLVGIEEAELGGGSGPNRMDARNFTGAVQMTGFGGNDTLLGGSGDDRLLGGGGNDWLEAGSAAEFVDGGEGADFSAHLWALSGTSPTDVIQHRAETSVLMAALAAAADEWIDLAGRISYVGEFTYRVQLFDANVGWVDVDVPFDGTLVTTVNGTQDPVPEQEDVVSSVNEFWPLLYQRAYLWYFEGINPLDGPAVEAFGGEATLTRALTAVSGRPASEFQLDPDAYTLMGAEYLDSVGYLLATASAGETVMTLSWAGHAYGVTNVYQNGYGQWRVTLYNPWGWSTTHMPAAVPYTPAGGDGLIEVLLEDLIAVSATIGGA
jgi:hypothetical protein